MENFSDIGIGGFSRVQGNGRIAKKLTPWKFIDDVVREIVFVTECTHENIIKILGVVFSDQMGANSFIELHLPQYPCDLTRYKIRGICDVVVISREILRGCRYLHDRGIIHGDIKPPNILIKVGPVPIAVLCDFGSAVRNDESYHVGTVQTVNYRAPEVEFNSRKTKFTTRIDIWSVGCIIYEMYARKQMVTWRRGCEDGSIYACEFFNLRVAADRKERLKNLYAVKSSVRMAIIMTKLGIGLDAMLYKIGFVEILSMCLIAKPKNRTQAANLIPIIDKIILREFPEVKCTDDGANDGAIDCINTHIPLAFDELTCVQNTPQEIIMDVTLDCLNCAERIYLDYTEKTGDFRLEVRLCCIYIASCTYCDSTIKSQIEVLMDLETTYQLSLKILAEYVKK